MIEYNEYVCGQRFSRMGRSIFIRKLRLFEKLFDKYKKGS